MTIRFPCPGCQKQYSVDDSWAGRAVKCKCGTALRVPAPQADQVELALAPAHDPLAAPAGDPLGGLPPSDPLADPLADPLGGPAAAPAAAPLAARPKPAAQAPEKKKKAKKPSQASKKKQQAILLSIVAGLVAVVMVVGAVLMVGAMNAAGGKTPEEVYNDYQRSTRDKKWAEQFAAMAPSSQQSVLDQLVSLADQMLETAPNTSGEIRDLFKQYGRGDDGSSQWWSGIKNKDVFYDDLIEAIQLSEENTWPINGTVRTMMRKSIGDERKRRASAKLVDLEVNGDSATAQMLLTIEGEEYKDPIEFEKVGSRWFVRHDEIPQFGGGGIGVGGGIPGGMF